MRLDRLAWSARHTTILLALGAGWLFDSFEVQLFSSAVGPLATTSAPRHRVLADRRRRHGPVRADRRHGRRPAPTRDPRPATSDPMTGPPAPRSRFLRPALLVMARAPVPGATKTRLRPLLGPDGCARLQAALIRHAATLDHGAGFLAHAPPDTAELVRPLVGPRMVLFPQHGSDLGQRMATAVDEAAIRGSGSVILIVTAPSCARRTSAPPPPNSPRAATSFSAPPMTAATTSSPSPAPPRASSPSPSPPGVDPRSPPIP